MKLNDYKNPKDRLEFLEKMLNLKLKKIKQAFIDDPKDIHCENLIGETTLPLGVVGPLKIFSLLKQREKARNYFVPLATSEGALIASINRGCKAISLSGGVIAVFEKTGVTRGPVFVSKNIEESMNFKEWLNKNFTIMSKAAYETSNHLSLKKMTIKVVGVYIYIRFYFDTEKAMGMNMATVATKRIVDLIEKKTVVRCLSLAGNFDIDKKPAWLNFINQRGYSAWAEVLLPKKTVEDTLKTTPEKIFEVWLAKCMIGSAISGSLGFNAHFANVVAAFYAAIGQDLAHVVEGSMGITIVKMMKNSDLYFSVYLPALLVGIIGGGTKLATKKEALAIIGAKTPEELVEVLAGTVLAGEISLLASLAEGSLAKAHMKLGR